MKKVLATDTNPGVAEWLDADSVVPTPGIESIEAVAATNLAAGQPCYVVGYVVATETFVVTGATAESASGTPSTGQWMRRLYVPAEAVVGGATATFYATRVVEMDTTGTAIGDPAYLGDDPGTLSTANNIVFSALGGPAGASFTARVVGEVITAGATGAVLFFGDYGSRSYTQGGQGQAEVVPFVVNLGITSGVNPTHTMQKRARLIDGWIQITGGSGTENWVLDITSPAPATVFSQAITTPSVDDVIRLTSFDFTNSTLNLGDVFQVSLDGAGLAGQCYLMFMPYN